MAKHSNEFHPRMNFIKIERMHWNGHFGISCIPPLKCIVCTLMIENRTSHFRWNIFSWWTIWRFFSVHSKSHSETIITLHARTFRPPKHVPGFFFLKRCCRVWERGKKRITSNSCHCRTRTTKYTAMSLQWIWIVGIRSHARTMRHTLTITIYCGRNDCKETTKK